METVGVFILYLRILGPVFIYRLLDWNEPGSDWLQAVRLTPVAGFEVPN